MKVTKEINLQLGNSTLETVSVQCELNEFRTDKGVFLEYSNFKAMKYARDWCSKKDNVCGTYFEGDIGSDCAHFISHCLQKGGITIKGVTVPDGCSDNLAIRVEEIVSTLKELSKQYDNIHPIPYDEAIWGDPGYFEIKFINDPSHAVIVKETERVPNEPNDRITTYYAHSNERCGSSGELAWYQKFGGAFRITDFRSQETRDELIKKIDAGKIIFDSNSTRLKNELLNDVTEKLRKLVLNLSQKVTTKIRISSLIRKKGDSLHVSRLAVDLGNEEIASQLLPLIATDSMVRQLEIDEIIFDAKVAGETDRNKWNYDAGKPHKYDTNTLNEHNDHIHFGVKN